MKNRERNRQMPRCGEWGVDLFGDTIPGMPQHHGTDTLTAGFTRFLEYMILEIPTT